MKKEQSALIKSRGFTLLEVIVAVFIFAIGIGGVFAFLQQTLILGSTLRNQLAASYLAQEGVEIVRNIRDTNFLVLPYDQWVAGLEGCLGNEYQADYLASSLQCFSGGVLNRSGNSYVHGAGTATLFTRKITVAANDLDPDPDLDRLDVKVEVLWQEKGVTRNFTVDTQLYNWTGL